MSTAVSWGAASALLDDHAPLTVSLSHGDPGLGNVLRLTDGRLALVDWEDAARRPVAHDVVKVAMSCPDPLSVVQMSAPAGLRPTMDAAGAAAWSHQLAVALAVFLSGWRHRHFRAVKRNSEKANSRRMQRMLGVLDGLLDDAPSALHRS